MCDQTEKRSAFHLGFCSDMDTTAYDLFVKSSHSVKESCCLLLYSPPLVPVAYLLSKLIRVDFQNKSNPLSILGIIFSINQVLYLLIAMWIFSAVPDKMLMILAIIFGAHLMPYGWLYNSKSYFAMSVIIPVVSLAIGLNYEPFVLAVVMLCIESVFCMALFIENKKA